jgi:ankyrin repeat protein
VVKLLVEKGADITVASNNGLTPVYSAANNSHLEVVKFLVEKPSPSVSGPADKQLQIFGLVTGWKRNVILEAAQVENTAEQPRTFGRKWEEIPYQTQVETCSDVGRPKQEF